MVYLYRATDVLTPIALLMVIASIAGAWTKRLRFVVTRLGDSTEYAMEWRKRDE